MILAQISFTPLPGSHDQASRTFIDTGLAPSWLVQGQTRADVTWTPHMFVGLDPATIGFFFNPTTIGCAGLLAPPAGATLPDGNIATGQIYAAVLCTDDRPALSLLTVRTLG